jgi:general secretion pathway protein E
MGVEAFLLASTITGIVAQRLVRRLCPHCKAPEDLSPLTRKELGLPARKTLNVYKAVGCGQCNGIGYEGRLGLYEYVEMDDILRGMIHTGASEADMASHAFKSRQTLLESGAAHILSGETTADEVLRVCRAKTLDET